MFVINTRLSRLFTSSNCLGFVFNSDFAIGTINTIDNNLTFRFICRVANLLLLLEDEHTGLVIIQDGHTGASVFSNQAHTGGLVVQFDVEVFVRFPTVIVNDSNGNFSLFLTSSEGNLLINSMIIFFVNSITIDSSDPNGLSKFRLV